MEKQPKKPVVMIINCHNKKKQKKNEWKSTKAKRIAQVSSQAEIGASSGPTTARSEPREIQRQQLVPVRVCR